MPDIDIGGGNIFNFPVVLWRMETKFYIAKGHFKNSKTKKFLNENVSFFYSHFGGSKTNRQEVKQVLEIYVYKRSKKLYRYNDLYAKLEQTCYNQRIYSFHKEMLYVI